MSNSTTLNAARATMKYKLETKEGSGAKGSLWESSKKLAPLFATEKRGFMAAVVAIVLSSLATLTAPVLIIRIINDDIRLKNTHGLLVWSLVVFGIFAAGAVASYVQVITMGGVGRRVLFHLRN